MPDERRDDPNVPDQDNEPVQRESAPAAQENRRPSSFNEDLRKEYKPPKKGNFALRIGLLAVAAVLVGVVVMLVQQWKPAPEQAPEVTKIPIMNYTRDAIESVTVKVADDEAYTVKQVQGETMSTYIVVDWPESIKLSSVYVSDAYATATTLNGEEIVEENPADLAQYGLINPTSTITVHLLDGSDHTVLLGSKLPSNVGWYLMEQGGSTVYRISDYVGTRMTHTSKDIRDLNIMPLVNTANADYVLIERSEGDTLELRRENSTVSINLWKILQPQALEAAADAVTTLVEQIAGVKLQSYVDTPNDYARYGLDEPYAAVTLKDSDGGELLFDVGSSDDSGSRYVRIAGSDEVYTMSAGSLGFLGTATVTSVVDKFAAIINIANVEKVDFTDKSGSYALTIEREEQYDEAGKLKELASGLPDYLSKYYVNGVQVDENPFKKLYQTMISVQVQGEIKGEVSGEPVAGITYTFNNGSAPVSTQYIPYQQDFYAMRQGEAVLFYTRRDTVDSLGGLTRTLLSLPKTHDAANALSIDIDMGEGDVRTFTREGGVATYRSKPVDASRFEDAYTRLTGVTLQEVTKVDTTVSPSITMTYRYSDGRDPIVVEFREAINDLYTMTVPGQEGQYSLSRRVLLSEIENFETWIN